MQTSNIRLSVKGRVAGVADLNRIVLPAHVSFSDLIFNL